MIYLARLSNVTYVPCCFEKDSSKTDKRDLNLAVQRVASLKLTEESRNAKLKASR